MSVKLDWTDNSSETGFSIERGTNGTTYAEIAQVAAGVVTYTDTSVNAGTTYYYRVRAFNGNQYSTYATAGPITTATFTTMTNKVGDPYNAFTSSGINITSAIYLNNVYAAAESNTIGMAEGQTVTYTVTLTLNSGQAPVWGIYSDPFGWDQSDRLTAGANVFNVTFPSSGNYYITVSNTLATNYSLTVVES